MGAKIGTPILDGKESVCDVSAMIFRDSGALFRLIRLVSLLLLVAGGLESHRCPARATRLAAHLACVPPAHDAQDMPQTLRLRGGSAAVWAAIENADSESDRERMEGTGDEDDAHMHDIDVEELLQDYEGKNSWEKLTKFIQALQDNYGEEEVDNVDVEEFG